MEQCTFIKSRKNNKKEITFNFYQFADLPLMSLANYYRLGLTVDEDEYLSYHYQRRYDRIIETEAEKLNETLLKFNINY